ncbi:MAG: tRNA 2-thiouridine(34) synthase MnmA [Candidatus Enterosoma sp.]|nr:tRNA 2-thiouridine(34) synthase MnmA [bacterium]MDY5866003.1 tRNA 2-thiouridine(34) synthase MnmA [Candidatus Enterosoma sp.]
MKRVLLGFSGGVDSAVSAYLLLKQGYQVTGCFMRNWDSIANNDIQGNPTLNLSKCSQELDYDDAIKTAEKLNIKLIRKDFIAEYYQEVFTSFLETYKRGYTPDPDVFCNKFIKFGHFISFAESLGYDCIAMGHYAKRVDENGHTHLYKAFDKSKDQSYFLSQLNEKQLSYCLFPLSDILKSEVRKIASSLDLPIANKKDSTGVCFIGERNFKKFLSNYLPSRPGDIVDIETGKVIAKHDGILYYTVGQHRGLNIGGMKDFPSSPFFVVGKDVRKNILYVSQENTEYRFSYSCLLTDFNYIGEDKKYEMNCFCKFRYRGEDLPVRLKVIDEKKAYLFYDKIPYVCKGQIAALYDGERLLGSGIISKIYDEKYEEISY